MFPIVARPEIADDLASMSPALLRAICLVRGLRDDPLARSLPLDYDSGSGPSVICRIGPRANLEA